MIVVEAAADLGVPLLRQRLVLVEARAVGQLRRREVEDALPRPLRDEVHAAEQILVRVAEAHAAADAALPQAGRPGKVEGGHHLRLVPRVQHPLRVRIRALALEAGQQIEPPLPQRVERRVDRVRLCVSCKQRAALLLVHHGGPLELRRVALVDVAEDERERLLGAGLEVQVELMRADRVPAVRDAAMGEPAERHRRLVQAVVHADEDVAGRVEPARLARAAEDGVVVPPLSILGCVIDGRALDLDLADRIRALEVRHVVQRFVEAELDVGEERHVLRGRPGVANRRLPDLRALARRHEEEQLDLDAVARADDARVAEAVAALVAVERRLRRLPARVPDRAAVVDVEIAADRVERRVVVAVAGEPAQPRVAPEGVAARGVGAEAEQLLVAEVVQPRERRVRTRDDVLAGLVVEVSVAMLELRWAGGHGRHSYTTAA